MVKSGIVVVGVVIEEAGGERRGGGERKNKLNKGALWCIPARSGRRAFASGALEHGPCTALC